ncbi:kinase-like domain-containing protein [Cytidiella melzeri]|nr:kinase-like domain-containing protein [Cytidiella melzeri]
MYISVSKTITLSLQYSYSKILAQHHYTERKCVIKVMKKNHLVELGHDMQIRRGLKALRASQSPFVVHFLSAFQDHNYLFIATSYVSDVTLLHLIQRFSHFSETNTRFYAAEIVSALRFLHDSSVIHGAVTPQNCLIGSDGHIQLCGFTYAYLATSEYQPFSCDPATFVDLAHYLAPEVLREEIVTPSADWYALGVMLYQMLVGVTPQRIDEPLRLLSEYSDSVQNLFGKLTNDDPLARDSDVQSHEWFAGIDWTQVEDLGLEPPYEPVCDDRDIEFPRCVCRTGNN